MLSKTHILFAIFLGLVAINYNFIQPMHGFLFLTAISSLLPDMDHSNSYIGKKVPVLSFAIEKVFGKRGFFHSIFGCLLVLALLYFALGPFYKTLFLAVVFGFISHLIADSSTKTGVKWLPLKSAKISGPVKTGGIFEWLFFIILSFLIITFALETGFNLINYI